LVCIYSPVLRFFIIIELPTGIFPCLSEGTILNAAKNAAKGSLIGGKSYSSFAGNASKSVFSETLLFTSFS